MNYLSAELTTEKLHFEFNTDIPRDCRCMFGAEYALLGHLGNYFVILVTLVTIVTLVVLV